MLKRLAITASAVLLCGSAAPDAPLTVHTIPEGARVTAMFNGMPDRSCVTPCTLMVPNGAPMAVRIDLEGHYAPNIPNVRWRTASLFSSHYVLEPNILNVPMRIVTPRPSSAPVSTDKYPAPSNP